MIGFHQTLIEIPRWKTVTLVEALWLASGIMAMTFASLRLKPLWYDYQISKRLGQDDLCIIAFGYLRREALRVATALSIIGTGIWTCTTDSARPGPAVTSISGLFLTASLLSISLIVSVQSVMDWNDRNKTIDIVLKRDKNE